jgi:hypothetical protein
MAAVTITADQPRTIKAVVIAAEAGQWLRCRGRDGRKAYGIPSSTRNGRYYLTTRETCDCPDAHRETCKHILAVRLHCELVRAMHGTRRNKR